MNTNRSRKNNLTSLPSIDNSLNLTKLSPIFFDINHPVYSKTIFIENRLFSVDITKGKHQIKIIATEDNAGDTYRLELSKNDALILMGGVLDWERLLKCIHIENENLALWQDDINNLP